MINSVQEAPLVLSSNSSAIQFSTDVVRTCSANCCGWLQHEEGSSQYQILKPGIYEITISTNVTSSITGQVSLAIENNGEVLSGTEMDATIGTANQYVNISTSRLIRVCNNANTTLVISSIPSVDSVTTQIPTVKNASLIIKKIS